MLVGVRDEGGLDGAAEEEEVGVGGVDDVEAGDLGSLRPGVLCVDGGAQRVEAHGVAQGDDDHRDGSHGDGTDDLGPGHGQPLRFCERRG